MVYPVTSTQYDRAITVFSPDGRLFQVQYAQEAVKRGTTALGVVCNGGVLLVVDKSVTSKLVKPDSVRKVFKIDDSIGCAISGLVADARRLVEQARIEAQRNKILYGEPIDVETLTKEICDLKQMYTQYGGARPFGTSLLVAGIDEKGPRLFETDPSGAFSEYYAKAIGSGAKEAEAILEKEYRQNMSFEEAVDLCLKIIHRVSEEKISRDTIDIGYIDQKTKNFRELGDEEVDKHIKRFTGAKRA